MFEISILFSMTTALQGYLGGGEGGGKESSDEMNEGGLLHQSHGVAQYWDPLPMEAAVPPWPEGGGVLSARLVAIKLLQISLRWKSCVIPHVTDEGLNNLKRVVLTFGTDGSNPSAHISARFTSSLSALC